MLSGDPWPPLPLEEWQDTCKTLHMWLQVVGKIRMALSTPLNHWWHVTLYVNARGLTTSSIPYGHGAFEMQFDFLEHRLEIVTCGGGRASLPLRPESVAVFYARVMEALRGGFQMRSLDQYPAPGDSRPDSLRAGLHTPVLRPRLRPAILPRPGVHRKSAAAVPLQLSRQEQPRPVFLGFHGFIVRAIFGKACRAAAQRAHYG